jgi:hypothetical protein
VEANRPEQPHYKADFPAGKSQCCDFLFLRVQHWLILSAACKLQRDEIPNLRRAC